MAGDAAFLSSTCIDTLLNNIYCSKKILFLLLWQALFSYSLGLLVDEGYLNIFLFRSRFLWLCFAPFVCWLDIRFRRYKFVIFGPLALLFVSLFYVIIAAWGNVSSLFNFLLLGATMLGSFSVVCYVAAMLPFVLDQLCDATPDELSTAVRWYFWADNFGYGLSNWFKTGHIQEFESSCGERIILFTIVPVSIMISEFFCQQWSDKTVNKFIMQVLHLTKHSYLERHSSYNDEEQPANKKSCCKLVREEVEAAKIILHLLPLIIFLNVFLNTAEASTSVAFKFSDVSNTLWNLRLGTWPYALLLVPFSRLLLSGCVSKCSQTILRYVNTGVFVSIACFMLISVTGVYRLIITEDHAYKYLSCDAIVTAIWPLSYAEWYWRLCPCFVWGIGKTIAYILILEFIIAQSPDKMKGLVFGILLACRGIVSLAFTLMMQFNFTLCFDLSISLVLVVLFVVFLSFPHYIRGSRTVRSTHGPYSGGTKFP